MNSTKQSPETVLVTGASSGIGYHLAREFAKHGHRLVIVAPKEGEIEEKAAELDREFSVQVLPIACDLTDETAIETITDAVGANGLTIDILANNAGLGQRGRFWENPPERDIQMIRLNAEAVVRMTRAFLPA